MRRGSAWPTVHTSGIETAIRAMMFGRKLVPNSSSTYAPTGIAMPPPPAPDEFSCPSSVLSPPP
ncbi:hypothetical protein ACFPRL_07630 [Pseudoclavibacter helvolus]